MKVHEFSFLLNLAYAGKILLHPNGYIFFPHGITQYLTESHYMKEYRIKWSLGSVIVNALPSKAWLRGFESISG